MSRESSGTYLSAVFVDYDNIYLSLKRKSEEAAKQFAKDAHRWVRAIERGELISPLNGSTNASQRRIVMSRCYGNPVPRRNQSDNSTDMSSFPFIRHHFLKGGFEIVDCPPLTAQLKNSADIRMVMDVRDFLTHDTYFDEFVILSSDADFTPLLHRLRAHARRTIVYSNDHTAMPYQALCDGEIREADLIELLLEELELQAPAEKPALQAEPDVNTVRGDIVAEVVRSVLSASAPQPLEALAERAIRVLGHAKTVGTEWGGAGNFRDLLAQDLPSTVALTEQAPYFAYDVSRAIARSTPQRIAAPTSALDPVLPVTADVAEQETSNAMAAEAPAEDDGMTPERAKSLQESIALIHQACKAPPLSPPEYRAVFTLLANEISANQMRGHQTIGNVQSFAKELGIDIRSEDLRFIIDIVGKDDPWFEKGASALVFAGRFRNYVIAQCQEADIALNADEIDLIDAWFAGGQPMPERQQSDAATEALPAASGSSSRPGRPDGASPAAEPAQAPFAELTARWWDETTTAREDELVISGDNDRSEEFPRIVRNRLKA